MPKVPPTLTIRPRPARIIAGATARIMLKMPVVLRSRMSWNSSRVVSTPVLPMGPDPPARLTSAKGAPSCASACRGGPMQLAASVMSQAKTPAPGRLRPRPPPPRAAASAGPGWPLLGEGRAISGPMPLVAPVIRTTCPFESQLHALPPSDNRAAIDQQVLPGDVARRIAQQEQDRVGHVDIRAHPAQRRARREIVVECLVSGRPTAPPPRPVAASGAARPRRRGSRC
jgi:hypothetical protein